MKHTTPINDPELTKYQIFVGYIFPISIVLIIFTGLFVYCNIDSFYSAFIAKDHTYKYYAKIINNRYYTIYEARKFKDADTSEVNKSTWDTNGYENDVHYLDTNVSTRGGFIFTTFHHIVFSALLVLIMAILLGGFVEDHYATPKQYMSKGKI